MALELFGNSNGLAARDQSTSTVNYYGQRFTGSGFTSNKIIRSSNNQITFYDTSSVGFVLNEPADLGSVSGKSNGSIWGTYNNNASRLYMAYNNIKYGYAPFRRYESSTGRTWGDTNNYGGTATTFRWYAGSGTNTSGSITSTYLNVGSTNSFVVRRAWFLPVGYTDQTGTTEIQIIYRVIDGSTTTYTSTRVNISGNANRPATGVTRNTYYSLTSDHGLRADANNTDQRFEIYIWMNNTGGEWDVGIDYYVVPTSYTTSRLVY